MIIIAASLIFFVHWSREASIDSDRKPAVNFEGTIVLPSAGPDATSTQLNVENITIGGKYKGIVVYAKPEGQPGGFENEPQLIKINDNPQKGLKLFLDLDEINMIEVLNRKQRWAYQRKKKSPKMEYIEISVTSKGEPGTTKNYLVEASRKVRADEKDPGGPIHVESSFAGIDRVIISGYHEQKTKKNNSKKKNNAQEPTKEQTKSTKEVSHSVNAPETIK